jgi:CBS domain containing-hemolysin-like protein
MYSKLLSFLMKVLTPLSAAAGFFGKIASKLIPDKSEPTVTEDELADIIETIEEEGVLDEGQTDLLQSAMEFAQSTVGDVVTPLDDVVAVEKYSSPESVLETINKSKFSRLPVYVGNKENIVGFIKIRDFLKKYINEGRVFGPAFDWRALILPSECLDSEAPIDEKMQEMSGKKLYLAYVKDKSGKTIGIVTIEDFLEELVGEIWDEDDIVNENFAKLGGNRFEISGKCPIGYAFSEMDLDPPDNIMPSQAIRAWVIAQLGHTPALDEEFTVGNLEIQITEMKDRVIKQLVIKVNYDDEPKLVESEEVK